jgi:hypothetical protein
MSKERFLAARDFQAHEQRPYADVSVDIVRN